MGHDRELTDGSQPGRCRGIGRPDSRRTEERRLAPPTPEALSATS